jgi:membrane protease YdiL (CAAX protease family)
MSDAPRGYLSATRHPSACLLFVVPLLIAYELGALFLHPGQPDALRNGADIWLRWTLGRVGLGQKFWPPLLLGSLLWVWCWLRRQDRPKDLVGVWIGMALESGAYALLLWGISRGLRPVLDGLGVPLGMARADPALAQTVCFIGAGIYEEMLFRLLLFTGLCWLFVQGELTPNGARLLAAATSAVLFAAAHNLGPQGENFEGSVFVFRTLAGVYFAVLYDLRGFGVAVGAHAGYDVLVGVVVPSV